MIIKKGRHLLRLTIILAKFHLPMTSPNFAVIRLVVMLRAITDSLSA